jgi:transposase
MRLSDAEYALLLSHIPASRGRPPENRRRTLDAIFWVALSRHPWRALPPELGRADTAHRQLRRWAKSGTLELLLVAIAGQRHSNPIAAALTYRLCRAFRRAARLLPLSAILLARRLGLTDALPCEPRHLPKPDLSEIAQKAALAALATPLAHPPGLFRTLARLFREAAGNPRRWRLA